MRVPVGTSGRRRTGQELVDGGDRAKDWDRPFDLASRLSLQRPRPPIPRTNASLPGYDKSRPSSQHQNRLLNRTITVTPELSFMDTGDGCPILARSLAGYPVVSGL